MYSGHWGRVSRLSGKSKKVNTSTETMRLEGGVTERGGVREVMDKVTRQCPQTTIFEEKGEPKRYRTEVLPLTSLTPYL